MATPNDTHRSFRLPAELDAVLVARANQLDRPVSWVILRSLEAQLLGKDVALGKAIARGATRRSCPGSGRRVTSTGSAAFPEVRCPCCEAELKPVLDDPVLGRYRMRSHRPKGQVRSV